MTELPPFLFILTSTALVLGLAVTIRGILGFRPAAQPQAAQAPSADGESTVSEASPQVTTGARDLREPIVMSVAGAIISIFALLAIAALVHSV